MAGVYIKKYGRYNVKRNCLVQKKGWWFERYGTCLNLQKDIFNKVRIILNIIMQKPKIEHDIIAENI